MSKDERLVELAKSYNVARFVSFGPDGQPRHYGLGDASRPTTLEEAAELLVAANPERAVGARTFALDRDERSLPLLIGLPVAELLRKAREQMSQGWGVILSESYDPTRRSISGVLYDGLMEFAPDKTPRCVENTNVCSLPLAAACFILDRIYGINQVFCYPNTKRDRRLEWTVCESPRGIRNYHTIVWDRESVSLADKLTAQPMLHWPNALSVQLGDKAFGLLMAAWAVESLQLGVQRRLCVPRSLVIGRHFPPFEFGLGLVPLQSVGFSPRSSLRWLRTCPSVAVPGKYTTVKGWVDPFQLLAQEDPTGEAIASVVVQEDVPCEFAGVAGTQIEPDGSRRLVVEGVRGQGDQFMLGQATEPLPDWVQGAVTQELTRLLSIFPRGIHVEWGLQTHPRRIVSIFQLHHRSLPTYREGGEAGIREWICPLPADSDNLTIHFFQAGDPLEKLRELTSELEGQPDVAIEVKGDVGILSHVGDVLRKSGVPSFRTLPE